MLIHLELSGNIWRSCKEYLPPSGGIINIIRNIITLKLGKLLRCILKNYKDIIRRITITQMNYQDTFESHHNAAEELL